LSADLSVYMVSASLICCGWYFRFFPILIVNFLQVF
jgi:hypothetical protein